MLSTTPHVPGLRTMRRYRLAVVQELPLKSSAPARLPLAAALKRFPN
jgi:hypothetical protein